jgi:DNA-directed RNA polymerase specialized sigma subunit
MISKRGPGGRLKVPIIDKKLFARIERELYNYHGNIQEINEQRQEIMYGSPMSDTSSKSEGRISDPTAMKATRLAKVAESEQSRWVNVIHDAIQKMPAEYKFLIKLKYFDGHGNKMVMDRLHVSQSAYYEWRENIVMGILLLATQRGLIKPLNDEFQENLW